LSPVRLITVTVVVAGLLDHRPLGCSRRNWRKATRDPGRRRRHRRSPYRAGRCDRGRGRGGESTRRELAVGVPGVDEQQVRSGMSTAGSAWPNWNLVSQRRHRVGTSPGGFTS
jgi:hypothetical protein